MRFVLSRLGSFTFIGLLGALTIGCSGGEGDGGGGGGSMAGGGTGGSNGTSGSGSAAGSGGATSAAGGGSSTGGSPAEISCDRTTNDNAYAYDLNLAPSNLPPGGIPVAEAPLFVSIGWDDNSESAGMNWAVKMHQDAGTGASFFQTSSYAPTAGAAWKAAFDAGFETGLHTDTHPHGTDASAGEWAGQISTNITVLTGGSIQIPKAKLFGFRSPFLEYNDALFGEVQKAGLWYDCSIEEGFDAAQDATNYLWPYTLDGGSPGHDYNRGLGIPTRQFTVGSHPGVIELPVYALLVPDDTHAAAYGFTSGLRSRMSATVPDFVEFGYKITGFDWNLWSQAGLSGAEVTAILKYNLDQRLAGNRAPLLFGAHSDQGYEESAEQRKALEDFITYAVSKPEVRVVSHKDIVDFLREPKPLRCY